MKNESKLRNKKGASYGIVLIIIDYAFKSKMEFNNFDGTMTNVNINIGSGFFIHNENFYFGLGVPNFLKHL